MQHGNVRWGKTKSFQVAAGEIRWAKSSRLGCAIVPGTLPTTPFCEFGPSAPLRHSVNAS